LTEHLDPPAGEERRHTTPLVTKRRLVFAFAALAAVLVPLVALGASDDWWFLRSGGAPDPTAPPEVVTEGEWYGHPWQLVAYPSATDGLCVSITPKGSESKGNDGAMGCAPFVGVARTSTSKGTPSDELPITYLAGLGGETLPAYIVGAVIEEASVVEVRFPGRDVLRVATIPGPESLEHVRFYAIRWPAGINPTASPPGPFPISIAGLNASGEVVACLAPQALAKHGTSALSDCR
jgi:hypothetical protein